MVITDTELSHTANKDLLQNLLSDQYTYNLLKKKEGQSNHESHGLCSI
jgi:hypothetical protein